MIIILFAAIIALSAYAYILHDEVRWQIGRKNYWYEQAQEYKSLWLASLLDGGPDGDNALEVPEEKEPETVKAMAKTVGR